MAPLSPERLGLTVYYFVVYAPLNFEEIIVILKLRALQGVFHPGVAENSAPVGGPGSH